MGKDVAIAEQILKNAGLITFGQIGCAIGTGPGATKAAAKRLGLEVPKQPNGRELLSIAQAQAIVRELCG